VSAARPLSARREHPLIDLHLFRNPRLTVAVIAMALFAIAFFGASLLFPQYFLLTRNETTLSAGLLLAPQGIGAMLTMPAAGILTDRLGPGKIVLTDITVIVIGMAGFTQVGVPASDVMASGDGFAAQSPSYLFLIGALFVMGLGMGCTMMPIMTAALQTLKDHEIARASTLMNINQQVAASIGTALFSVLLTNGFNSSDATTPPAIISDMTHSFASCFTVGVVLVACCLIPAWFLPRSKPAKQVDPAAVIGAQEAEASASSPK